MADSPVTRIVADYNDAPGLRRSDLVMAVTDPEKYRQIHIAKTRKPDSGAHFAFGNRFESVLKRGFGDTVIIPADALNANGHRRGPNWTRYKAQHEHHSEHVTQAEYDRGDFGLLKQMCDNVRDHLLASSIVESFTWNVAGSYVCPITGVLRKCEIDLIDFEHRVIVDVKTTKDLSYRRWPYTVAEYNYDVQAATQIQMAALLTGTDEPDWEYAWICGCKRIGSVEMFSPSESIIETGQQLNIHWLEEFKQRQEDNNWRVERFGSLRTVFPRSYDWRSQKWLGR